MKAYIGIKYHADGRNRERIEMIAAALEICGWETVCIVRDLEGWGDHTFTPKVLMQETFAIIRHSDVAIIDLTEKGVGLGIEAGYAHAIDVPIVTIAQSGSDISTTLSGISKRLFMYENQELLTAFFDKELKKTIVFFKEEK